MTQFMTLDLHNGQRPTRKPSLVIGQPADKRHVTVIIDGIQSSGVRPGASIRKFLLGYGDVILVRFPREGGFNYQQFIRNIMEAIQGYEEVTFLGLSLGGLLAHDILAKRHNNVLLETKYRLILADAPHSKEGLVSRRGAEFLARFERLPCERALSTLMFSRLSFADFPPRFVPKSPTHLGTFTGEQLAELAEHVRLSANYPLTPWLRQLAYLVEHGGPQSYALKDVPAVFVQSEHDDLVLGSAYGPWNQAYKTTHPMPLPLLRVNGPHVGLMERPAEWQEVLKQALAMLGLHPLN